MREVVYNEEVVTGRGGGRGLERMRTSSVLPYRPLSPSKEEDMMIT